MPDIFRYTDYRKYLSDFYEAKKASDKAFTHRHVARSLGFKSTGTFAQILQGKTNIAPDTMARFAAFLGLKKNEAAYFEALVAFNQSKGHEEKKRHFKKVASFSKSEFKRVEARQYAFYEQWYYSVVREILAFHSFRGDYRALGKMLDPPISPSEARKAVALLEELGFIRKNSRGVYERADAVITTGPEARSLAVNQFLRETMDLAKSALDDLPRDRRSVSALTLSLPEEGFRAVEEKIQALRRELLEMARSSPNPRCVIQVNFQAFPVTRGEGL